MNESPVAAGKSSFDLIDTHQLFSELGLKQDTMFLDVACGRGAYSIASSEYIGKSGAIYAVDLWKEGIESLQKELSARHISNIHARIADVSKRIPVSDHSIDVCLMATVLHDLIQDKTDSGTLREVRRVISPHGLLAVIEFKKIEGPPGPPREIRISPEELEERLKPHDFRLVRTRDIGPFNYLSIFIPPGDSRKS